MASLAKWFGRCDCKPGEDSFYNEANGWWSNDESVQIPGEYASWGSFIQLHDASLKTQVQLCKELSEHASNDDEKKVALIWNARMAKFKEWDEGKGDYEPILGELAELSALPQDSTEAWSAALGRYFVKCMKSGISLPLSFDKGPNLSDSENVVLDLSPASGSLPSREYYTEENFAEQRAQFKNHLTNVAALVGLEPDFPERVMRFETKLAQISMKPDQSRQFDQVSIGPRGPRGSSNTPLRPNEARTARHREAARRPRAVGTRPRASGEWMPFRSPAGQYFTVTTLEGFLSGVNEMKALAEKLENYQGNAVEEGSPDAAILSEADYKLDDADGRAAAFVRLLYSELGLEACLKRNFEEHYTSKGASPVAPETAETRMIVFDGDFFRRIFPLILSVHNAPDLVAYMKYSVIKWGGAYCTKALDEEIFDFHSRKLGGQKEQKSHEKRTVGTVNAWAGELLGKVYVARYFSLEDKAKLQAMIGEVLDVMRRSLRTNDWLTEPTKEKALAKLAKFTTKIGFPDKWKDHARLAFEEVRANDRSHRRGEPEEPLRSSLPSYQEPGGATEESPWRAANGSPTPPPPPSLSDCRPLSHVAASEHRGMASSSCGAKWRRSSCRPSSTRRSTRRRTRPSGRCTHTRSTPTSIPSTTRSSFLRPSSSHLSTTRGCTTSNSASTLTAAPSTSTPSTLGRSVPSSPTKSRTATTTKGASLTTAATSATGGRPRTPRSSKRRRS